MADSKECAWCGSSTHYVVVAEMRELVPMCSEACLVKWKVANAIKSQMAAEIPVRKPAPIHQITIMGKVSV